MEEEISNSSLNFVNPSEIELGNTIVELSRRQTCILHSARWNSRRYVLKSLREEYASNPVYIEALRKEFELGVRLDHPDIVRVVAFEEIATLGRCIVMEWIEGQPLNDFINAGASRRERRTIAVRIANALAYMHEAGVSHRDLKPDNILITLKGHNVKIIDFGLGDADNFTTFKSSRATTSYGAPEQLGKPSEADAAADVYSFGKILQLLLPKWSKRRLIKRCLRNDPTRRPSMAEVAASLASRRWRNFSIALLIASAAACGIIALRDHFYFSAPPTVVISPEARVDTIYIANTADTTVTSTAPLQLHVTEKATSAPTNETATETAHSQDSIFKRYQKAVEINVTQAKAALMNVKSPEERAKILSDYARCNDSISADMTAELRQLACSELQISTMITNLYIFMNSFSKELTEMATGAPEPE